MSEPGKTKPRQSLKLCRTQRGRRFERKLGIGNGGFIILSGNIVGMIKLDMMENGRVRGARSTDFASRRSSTRYW